MCPRFPRRPSRATRHRLLASATALLTAAVPPFAGAQNEAEAPVVEVIGHYETGLGNTDAASQGSVTSKLLLERPTLRAGEVLELVPGMVVTQHSGGGKGNQYYVRGFNLDHGTDFAVHVDGMPVNMRTHGHGQGYADINFVIPELISRIDFRKGPYFADEGDFASAGAAHFRLQDTLEHGLGIATLGTDRYWRYLLADAPQVAQGNLLYALEFNSYDGPWVSAEDLLRMNGMLRYSRGNTSSGWNITGMAYDAQWDSTDQIPQRAVNSGQLNRFGAVDTTDGGESRRYSLSGEWRESVGTGYLRANAYALKYRLDLWSNFTYFLNDPVNGDQFQQSDSRKVYGGEVVYGFLLPMMALDSENRIGAQVRHDDIGNVALHATRARQILTTTRRDSVQESSIGLFYDNTLQWTPWLRTMAGLRMDAFRFDTQSSIPQNSGSLNDTIVSPKFNAVLGPWSSTEYFVNYGWGFHSNDARGTVISIDPATGDPAERVTPLVRTKGEEIGLRTHIFEGLQSSLSLWQLKSRSELVFIGDAGTTEAGRPTRRQGIEWITTWRPKSWLTVDVDLALSRSRFTDDDPAGNRVPGSPERTLQAGFYFDDMGPWSGAIQVRHFGPRPLIEDNSFRSKSTTVSNLRIGYDINREIRASLDVLNVFNRKDSDIDYFYCSRLANETPGTCADGSAGVDDLHFHPVEPRQWRFTVNVRF